MMMDLVQHRSMAPTKLAKTIMAIFRTTIKLPHLDIPTNPPEIVTFGDEEFTLNMNNMDYLMPYLVKFRDSVYLIWKNEDGALVMEEVP